MQKEDALKLFRAARDGGDRDRLSVESENLPLPGSQIRGAAHAAMPGSALQQTPPLSNDSPMHEDFLGKMSEPNNESRALEIGAAAGTGWSQAQFDLMVGAGGSANIGGRGYPSSAHASGSEADPDVGHSSADVATRAAEGGEAMRSSEAIDLSNLSDGDDDGDTVVVVGMKRGREGAESEHARLSAATRAAILRGLPPSGLARMQAGGDATSALRQVTTTAAASQQRQTPPVYPGSLMHLRQNLDPSLRASSSSRIQPVNGAPQTSQQQVSQLERRSVPVNRALSSIHASTAESRAEVNPLQPPQIPPLPAASTNPEVMNLRERLKQIDDRRVLIESIIQSRMYQGREVTAEQLAKMYEVFCALSSDALRFKDRLEFLEPGFLQRQKRLEEEWHRNVQAIQSRWRLSQAPVVTSGAGGQRSSQQSSSVLNADHKAALESLLESLQTSSDAAKEMEPPQRSMTVSVMRHQKMALAWMYQREVQGGPRGGFLADDQGLGKTVSAISLMLLNGRGGPDLRHSNAAGGRLSSRLERGAKAALGSSSRSASMPDLSADRKDDGSLEMDVDGAAGPKEEPVSDEIVIGDDDGQNGDDGGRPAQSRAPQLDVKQEGAGGRTSGKAEASEGSDGDDDLDAAAAAAGLFPAGNLVICPTSVLHQWAREIKDKVNAHAGFSMHVYHGKDKLTEPALLARYQCVVTTYGTLASEAPAKERQAVKIKKQGSATAPIMLLEDDSDNEEDSDSDDDGGAASRKAGKRRAPSSSSSGGPLYQVHWHRIVLDEAQSIKNPRTLAANAAWGLQARFRWCLSGTPIQNSIDDLYSYFRFLKYKPYCVQSSFRELIKDKIAINPEAGYKLVAAILAPVLLRRTKNSKLGDGQPIVNLPPRNQELVQAEFTQEESAFYKTVQTDSLEQLKREGGRGSYINMLYMLLRLRQACSHPWLVQGGANKLKQASAGKVSGPELAAARKIPPGRRQPLLEAILHPLSQCPVCNDVPEDPVVSVCGHVYCRQCSAGQLEGSGHEDEFLCTTCSKVLRNVDMFSAAALEAVSGTSGSGRGEGRPGPSGLSSGSSEQGSSTRWVSSTKVDRLIALLEGVRGKNESSRQQVAVAAKAGLSTVLAAKSKSDARLAGSLKRLGPVTPAVTPSASPSPPPQQGGGASSSSLPSAGGSLSSAAGTSGAVAGGHKGRPEKVIVFSQWTSMLDVLQVPLKDKGFQFRRLDGTMTVPSRERAITDFETKDEVLVLLVSLKAAALGVNLTVANHVVLMDLWWNPTVEEQAIDRAHRIGQTRPVNVTRITIKDTVEDRILELQESKRQVVSAALNEEGRSDASQTGTKLSFDELKYLFGIGTAPKQQGPAGPSRRS